MEPYKNLGRNSNVAAFKIGDDRIVVQFSDGSIYTYSYRSAGQSNIEHMKRLAKDGVGLNSFINTRVRKAYESKERW